MTSDCLGHPAQLSQLAIFFSLDGLYPPIASFLPEQRSWSSQERKLDWPKGQRNEIKCWWNSCAAHDLDGGGNGLRCRADVGLWGVTSCLVKSPAGSHPSPCPEALSSPVQASPVGTLPGEGSLGRRTPGWRPRHRGRLSRPSLSLLCPQPLSSPVRVQRTIFLLSPRAQKNGHTEGVGCPSARGANPMCLQALGHTI